MESASSESENEEKIIFNDEEVKLENVPPLDEQYGKLSFADFEGTMGPSSAVENLDAELEKISIDPKKLSEAKSPRKKSKVLSQAGSEGEEKAKIYEREREKEKKRMERKKEELTRSIDDELAKIKSFKSERSSTKDENISRISKNSDKTKNDIQEILNNISNKSSSEAKKQKKTSTNDIQSSVNNVINSIKSKSISSKSVSTREKTPKENLKKKNFSNVRKESVSVKEASYSKRSVNDEYESMEGERTIKIREMYEEFNSMNNNQLRKYAYENDINVDASSRDDFIRQLIVAKYKEESNEDYTDATEHEKVPPLEDYLRQKFMRLSPEELLDIAIPLEIPVEDDSKENLVAKLVVHHTTKTKKQAIANIKKKIDDMSDEEKKEYFDKFSEQQKKYFIDHCNNALSEIKNKCKSLEKEIPTLNYTDTAYFSYCQVIAFKKKYLSKAKGASIREFIVVIIVLIEGGGVITGKYDMENLTDFILSSWTGIEDIIEKTIVVKFDDLENKPETNLLSLVNPFENATSWIHLGVSVLIKIFLYLGLKLVTSKMGDRAIPMLEKIIGKLSHMNSDNKNVAEATSTVSSLLMGIKDIVGLYNESNKSDPSKTQPTRRRRPDSSKKLIDS